MKETTSLKEKTILREIELAKTEPNMKSMLETLYLDENRQASFQRYCESKEFKSIFAEIARHAKHDWEVKICEVGAGPGFLAVALAKAGFQNVSILEPNSEWITGTGFIASEAQRYGVKIWNELDSWYESDELYDLIITKACVHHFDNVCKTGAELRCKIDEQGKWLMFDEFFANSPEDLYTGLINHAHVSRYGQYEWPYSASLYVELMHLAGYTLKEVIPARYKSNYIARNISGKTKFSKPVTWMTYFLIYFKLTLLSFRIERFIDRWLGIKTKLRLFTRPQLLVFELREMDYPIIPSEGTIN